ncbi:hypothetical protein IFM89_012332, partial [Coptis chinensis]
AFVFKGNAGDCAAFLVNSDRKQSATVNFQGVSYVLPPLSISISLDCKTVIFNTAKVSAQYGTRSVVSSQKLDAAEKWQIYKEIVPNFADTPSRASSLPEQMGTTKDASDYLWYTYSFEHNSTDAQSAINIFSLGHVVHTFINNLYIGRKCSWKSWSQFPLSNGTNNITLLGVMVGLLTTFDAPQGDDPVVLNLASMERGEAWINEQSIGRYWSSFYSPKGVPSQHRKTISKIVYASYGNPLGDCTHYATGSCYSSNTRRVVEAACLGQMRCSIIHSGNNFGQDPCPGISKSLLVDAQCG